MVLHVPTIDFISHMVHVVLCNSGIQMKHFIIRLLSHDYSEIAKCKARILCLAVNCGLCDMRANCLLLAVGGSD